MTTVQPGFGDGVAVGLGEGVGVGVGVGVGALPTAKQAENSDVLPCGSVAVQLMMPLLLRMSASDQTKGRCVAYIGSDGAGHFVKMVHNGIEYGIMQLIAESYDLLRSIGKCKNADLAEIFSDWSRSNDLGSFLMEITAKIFRAKEDRKSVV